MRIVYLLKRFKYTIQLAVFASVFIVGITGNHGFFFGFFVGVLGATYGLNWMLEAAEKKDYPFKFVCQEKGCHFVIRGNDAAFIAERGQDHVDRGEHGPDRD